MPAVILSSLLAWACPQPAQAELVSFAQVTNTTAGGSDASALNANGTRIAFKSTANLVNAGGCPALPGNADGNAEIYLFDTTTNCYTQVTNTTTNPNFDLSINAAGTRIAFVSFNNLVNPGGCPALPGNADGNGEIFLFDTTVGCYSQVTNTTGGGSGAPSINFVGTRVAFASVSNLVNPGGCSALPGNADGNSEIYLFDSTTGCYAQVTTTTAGNSFDPSISAAGGRVTFRSTANLANPGGCSALPGNIDGNSEIYLFDSATGCYTQVTTTTAGNSFSPSLQADGNRILFSSLSNLANPAGCAGLPGNADGFPEIYLFDTVSGCYVQVTNTTASNNIQPSLNADGTRIAFSSTGNTTQLTPCLGCPGNADANFEMFLASVSTPVPTLSEWVQLVMVVLLLFGGLLALRRRGAPTLRPGRSR